MTKKQQREAIFNKYDGRCAYCGDALPTRGWHCDHLEPIRRNREHVPGHWNEDKTKWINEHYIQAGCEHPERETIDNYMPACASCNINKHSMSFEDFRDSIAGFVNSLNRYSVQYKIAKRYGLIREEPKQVIFYFEQNT